MNIFPPSTIISCLRRRAITKQHIHSIESKVAGSSKNIYNIKHALMRLYTSLQTNLSFYLFHPRSILCLMLIFLPLLASLLAACLPNPKSKLFLHRIQHCLVVCRVSLSICIFCTHDTYDVCAKQKYTRNDFDFILLYITYT